MGRIVRYAAKVHGIEVGRGVSFSAVPYEILHPGEAGMGEVSAPGSVLGPKLKIPRMHGTQARKPAPQTSGR